MIRKYLGFSGIFLMKGRANNQKQTLPHTSALFTQMLFVTHSNNFFLRHECTQAFVISPRVKQFNPKDITTICCLCSIKL